MFSFAHIPEIRAPFARRRVPLPLCSAYVSAGFPSPAEDFVDGVLDLNDLIDNPASTFIVRVSGFSMTGAGIFDGDLLVVDRSITPATGHIVVAVHGGEMLVKRLTRRKKQWWLVPEAPNHPEFVPLPMVEGSEVWGVVKNVVRRLA